MYRPMCYVEGRREIHTGFLWGNMKERTSWKTPRCGWEDNIIDCPKPGLCFGAWEFSLWSCFIGIWWLERSEHVLCHHIQSVEFHW